MKCDHKRTKIEYTPNSIHNAKEVCVDCNCWIRWVPKELDGRQGVSRYSLAQVSKFYNIQKPFCFFCGRKKEKLGVNETLTRDHIKRIEEGGIDSLRNLQILCSACHKLKHWADLYMRIHFNGD